MEPPVDGRSGLFMDGACAGACQPASCAGQGSQTHAMLVCSKITVGMAREYDDITQAAPGRITGRTAVAAPVFELVDGGLV